MFAGVVGALSLEKHSVVPWKCFNSSLLQPDLYHLNTVGKLFRSGRCQPVIGLAVLVQDVKHHHRASDYEHAKEEVGSLQGIGVRVEVEDAIEIEDDLE